MWAGVARPFLRSWRGSVSSSGLPHSRQASSSSAVEIGRRIFWRRQSPTPTFPFVFSSPRGFEATTCMAFPLRWVVAEPPMKRRMPSRRLPLMFVSGRRGVSVALQTSEPTNRIAAPRLALPCASWSLTPRNAQWRTATRRESSFDVLSLRGGAPTTGIVRRGRAEPTPSP